MLETKTLELSRLPSPGMQFFKAIGQNSGDQKGGRSKFRILGKQLIDFDNISLIEQELLESKRSTSKFARDSRTKTYEYI